MEQILDSTQSTPAHRGYAGFWLRFAALLIDGIVLTPVFLIFYFILMKPFYDTLLNDPGNYPDSASMSSDVISMVITYYAIVIVTNLLYFALMESSSKQATLGKVAVGIKVTSANGEKITFINSIGRNAGKYVSMFILYIGFLMAAFTEKKQALHDLMASTLVVKK